MSPNSNNQHANGVLTTLRKCAAIVEFSDLARSVGEAFLDSPNLCLAGITVYDEERQYVQRFTVTPRSAAVGHASPRQTTVDDEEFPLDLTELPALLDEATPFVLVDLSRDLPTSNDRLSSHGGGQMLSVPIRLRGHLLGSLFVASLKGHRIPDEARTLAMELGQLVTPVLFNCVNHARFARGDRRRNALIDLSRVINSSLELDTVLKHARRVIGGLEGHCVSAIFLLNEGTRTFRSYRNFQSPGRDRLETPEPTVHRVKGSVVGWLLEHGTTYESEDLAKECQYDDDYEFRERGVRRYIAIPLLARGRILGGFMFGTDDVRPRRKVEYWLYENIALQMALAVDNAVKHEQLENLTDKLANHNAYLRKEIQTEQGFGEMRGGTALMEALRSNILQVAATDATVLITGETGVGKELVARYIHKHSLRSGQPFIKVNCPSMPESMVESELFGHERGAFTSAVERRIGRFELARDGTLFLDEIGDLSLAVQAKLLGVLQDGEFERVGGSKTLVTNARIITATNRDLPKAIKEGRFRADLYFRLNVFPIFVPPLRDRREDIPVLVEAFSAEFSQKMGKRFYRFNEDSLSDLCKQNWPGNIRELRHLIERSVILSKGPHLEITSAPGTALTSSPLPETPAEKALPSLEDVQADHIRRALEACGGIIEGAKGAAAMLGLNPSTLRFRMKRLGITRPSSR